MTLVSKGYSNSPSEQNAQDYELLRNHFDLLVAHESRILNCAEYFFCSPSFASCSCPYLTGDGPLPLGYLMLGWSRGVLLETCSHCAESVRILSFGGSPLSGHYGWSGHCARCNEKRVGKSESGMLKLYLFIADLRKMFPTEVIEWEEYDGQSFDWGAGLIPAKKTRQIIRPVVTAVTFATLIDELRGNVVRISSAPSLSLLKRPTELKLTNR